MPALLAIWHDVDASVEDDYTAWYDEEHFPERLSVPGFLNGQRFEALDGTVRPARLAFYEVESLAVLSGGEYRRRLEHPTPRTTRVISGFRNSVRGACNVVHDAGAGHGGYCVTIALREDVPIDALGTPIEGVRSQPGVVRVRMIQGDPSATGPMTAEQRLRGAPDRAVGRMAIIETDRVPASSMVMALEPFALAAAQRYRRLRFAVAAHYQR